MLLRATSPLLDGWTGEASISIHHPASSFGMPVLLIVSVSCDDSDCHRQYTYENLQDGNFMSPVDIGPPGIG